MFEAAEVGNAVKKTKYKKETEHLRPALLTAQHGFANSDFSLVIVVSGAEGAGKEDVVDLLHEWMDARGIETHAMWETTDEEANRPPFWRFWRILPPYGKTAILFGSWYSAPIIERVYGKADQAKFERELARIRDFERMLTAENVVVVKFWLHLSKNEQKKKLKELKADPRTRWRVSKNTWKFFDEYDNFRRVSEETIEHTNTGDAPWTIVEAADWRYRNLTVVSTILQRLQDAQAEADIRAKKRKRPVPYLAVPKDINIIRQLDLKKKLDKETYERRLNKLQGELAQLSRKLQHSDRSLVAVFEGADAAGKGGAIRRVTAAIDARLYKVNAVAAPTDEEAARPYLWRFWRQMPRRGHIAIFDRSWYGRVLVERVEGFSPPPDWKRAYSEINEFESELSEFGVIVVKFWLTTSPQEQLRRFKDRQVTPYKQYKITEEDWRNRKKWNAYEAAACDMIERTSTDQAPWTLVAANDKRWARIKVLEGVVGRLKQHFKLD